MSKLLIVDNNDSFTYNLVQLTEETGLAESVVRNCKDICLDEIDGFDKILISPGPGVPSDYPVLRQILLKFHAQKSILGICLGHQAIAEAFGLGLFNMGHVRHGLQEKVTLTDDAGYLFDEVPRQFYAGLYHSWAVSVNDPEIFNVTATGRDGIIMGLAHIHYDVQGIQFHPESFMSEFGKIILYNWLQNKRVAPYEATLF